MIESLMFNYLLVLLIRDDAVGFRFVLATTPTLLSIIFGTVVFARPPDTRRLSNYLIMWILSTTRARRMIESLMFLVNFQMAHAQYATLVTA